MTNTYALDSSECYAPTEEGGWGYCGAPTCRNQYITCSDEGGGPPVVNGVYGEYRSDYAADGSDCTSFLDMSDYEEITDWGFNGRCDDTCTQRTDGVCDGARSSSSLQYPLDVVDFDEGVWTNNVDLFDGTAGNEGIPYLYDDGLGIGTYGLPDGAGVGITVNGMQNWVTQNNRGEWNQPTCETSPCNLHVGQGAGQPHIFDYTCGMGNDRCDDGDEVVISTTGPLFCFRADLSQQEGSSALLSFTTSDAYAEDLDMMYACCDMTDYYAITGLDQKDASDFFSDDSTGNGCHVDCDDGYAASGITRCVEGAFVEYATCEADGTADAAGGAGKE
ncbi:DNA binding protein [Aureococcus anophagefferens]|nr:DNA binding protein [Aureococcus anophagefferens]